MSNLDPSTTKTTPATLLEGVNTLLRAIGRADIMALDPARMDQTSYAALATINEESVKVQTQGWFFNTEEAYPVAPAEDGSISIPESWVKVRLNAKSAGRYRVTRRGGKLYDKEKHSTTSFTETLYLDFVEVFPFEQVSAHVRNYIIARAGRIFGPGRIPESATYRFSKEEEDIAYSEALQADDDESGNTLNETSPHFQAMGRR